MLKQLELKTARIEALTDGVFAIAMTLLVLDLDIGNFVHGSDQNYLHDRLLNAWPHLLHYVESFIILAIFWIKHHQQSHFIRHSNNAFLWLNLLSLLFICLIPFSTSLAGDWGLYKVAAIIFEANMLLAGLTYWWQWSYASGRGKLLKDDTPKGVPAYFNRGNLIVPVMSAISIVVSLFFARLGTGILVLTPLIFSIVNRRSSKKTAI